jgi:hypothetical protein
MRANVQQNLALTFAIYNLWQQSEPCSKRF